MLVNVTFWPGLTVPTDWFVNARADVERLTAGMIPVPVSATVCGDPGALSLMVMFPVRLPATVGANATEMLQFAATARVTPQVLLWTKSPVAVMPPTAIVSEAVPLLVNVRFWRGLTVPTNWLVNASTGGERIMAGAIPVPIRATVCGDPGALSVMVTLLVRLPANVGTNVTEMLQLAATASVAQVFPTKKSPVAAMPLIASEAVPLLVKVRFWVGLMVPTNWLVNTSAVSERLTAGAIPVPVRVTVCGEPGALSLIVTLPVLLPVIVGANVTEMLQLAATAKVGPQVLV